MEVDLFVFRDAVDTGPPTPNDKVRKKDIAYWEELRDPPERPGPCSDIPRLGNLGITALYLTTSIRMRPHPAVDWQIRRIIE